VPPLPEALDEVTQHKIPQDAQRDRVPSATAPHGAQAEAERGRRRTALGQPSRTPVTVLEYTFLHLTGVGPKRERALWSAGCFTWGDLLGAKRRLPFATDSTEVKASQKALAASEADWFAKRLPRHEHWRVAASFPDETMFLDIETTGLSRYYHEVTLIGWGIGRRYGVLLAGDDPNDFLEDLAKAKAVITFNGSSFDLPFIRQILPEAEFPRAHIDLRHAGRRHGLVGPQKQIETGLGYSRPKSVQGLDGSFAPDLWRLYQRGDLRSLRKLVSYNHSDLDGMRAILRVVAHASLVAAGIPGRRHRPTWSRPVLQFGPAQPPLGSTAIELRKWKGPVGPRVRLNDLAIPQARPLRRVVGLDLSGSERRRSGWAVVTGDLVVTAVLETDEEIVARTVDAEPDLVSVDAPLTLPAGRQWVTDDDPTRPEFGIMRECERILKRRGVNVYPCLIRSMQSLTERGIRLARRLRGLGLPVIESYPGAMQDVLGIPRKRESVTWLRQGLVELGLKGRFSSGNITHDELDAISSAVVGQLAWVGMVERLGNDAEGHLIIPRVTDQPAPSLLVVGLSGRTGSGKSTAAAALGATGYNVLSTRAILTTVLEERGEAVTRETLQRLGAEVHRSLGQRWLFEHVCAGVGSSGSFVIDGLRFAEDHAYLAERYGGSFLHIHVEAPMASRRERFVARGGTVGEFESAEADITEAGAERMGEIAHFTVVNSRGPRQLALAVVRTIAAQQEGTRPCQ
jgi:uncharacterized protein YprB with RNaseH-like and TPR domain/predicted nuclease with RNAse H fold/dephospho-CoA kinase